MTSTSTTARVAGVAAAVAALGLLAGCTGGDDRAEPAASSPASVPTATPTPEPSRSAAPTTPAAERPLVAAGTVAEDAPATASGEGPARVSVVRDGDFGVVAHLDCSACTGDVVLTADGRMSPWGAGPAPLTGTYLVDLLEGTDAEQGFVLDAQGPWTLTFQSWNDLPVVAGEQQGRGAAVLLLGDDASGVRIDYSPAGPDDTMLARVVSAVDVDPSTGPASLVLGDEQAFSETAEVALPGVVALSTNGTWSVTPVP
ncbi:hypothetical protein [Cellulomonas pakistanensis]|uniref:Lipoprotein n=1 Tax=Cellulomonas pakistanensis TaxID=992287 RepID=A0A919U3X2_9CELL|nr:hypothetical protein [Cellulomonas pakistanensis]GIG36806.1 hypothetical protein Cpa01nite_21870 [Cellulomonas pakistanensis]